MSDRQTYVADATVTVDAALHDIWAVWVDARAWTTWDDSLEKVEIHGNFKEGNKLTLTPRSGHPLESTLVSVTQGEEFTSQVDLPFGVIRNSHRMERFGALAKITHAVTADIDPDHAEEFGAKVWPAMQDNLATSLINLVEIVGN